MSRLWVLAGLAALLLLTITLQQSHLQTEPLPYYVDTENELVWFRFPGELQPGESVTVYISRLGAYPPDPYSTFIVYDDFNTDLNTEVWSEVVNGACRPGVGVYPHPDQSYVEVNSLGNPGARCDVFLAYNNLVPSPTLDWKIYMYFRVKDPNWGGVGSVGWYRSAIHGFFDPSGYSPGSSEHWLGFLVSEHGRRIYYLKRVTGTVVSRISGDDYTDLDPTNWYSCTLIVSGDVANVRCTSPGYFLDSISGIGIEYMKPYFAAYQWSNYYPVSRILVDKVFVAAEPASLQVTVESCDADTCVLRLTMPSDALPGHTNFQVAVPFDLLASLGPIDANTHLYVSLSPPRTPTTLNLQIS